MQEMQCFTVKNGRIGAEFGWQNDDRQQPQNEPKPKGTRKECPRAWTADPPVEDAGYFLVGRVCLRPKPQDLPIRSQDKFLFSTETSESPTPIRCRKSNLPTAINGKTSDILLENDGVLVDEPPDRVQYQVSKDDCP